MGRVIKGEARRRVDGHRPGLGGGIRFLARMELERFELLLPLGLTHGCNLERMFLGLPRKEAHTKMQGLHRGERAAVEVCNTLTSSSSVGEIVAPQSRTSGLMMLEVGAMVSCS